jgi:N-methylhydantoinase A
MSKYLGDLDRALSAEGFRGRLLIVSSAGGVLDVGAAREAPIHSLGSGPAMAPIAGRHFAVSEGLGEGAVVVTDTGGTSFDISLVRNGSIPWTRETWIGGEYTGDITGFPSVDVKSIGAGGGSIAWVDDGGLLHVGPQSAGADPGPACYGYGGTAATVTDACVTLGFLDPDYFLGGSMRLDADAARGALEEEVGRKLNVDAVGAAWAVLAVATEEMVRAIEETTVYRGIDPVGSILVGGGGAAGFNVVSIARRLGCKTVLIPELGPGLSAAGALLSNLISDYVAALPTSTGHFNFEAVNDTLADLQSRCSAFSSTSGATPEDVEVELFAEARYPDQVWELEVPLTVERFASEDDVEQLRQAFHATHRQLFGVADDDSRLEVISWRARVTCRLRAQFQPPQPEHCDTRAERGRDAFFGPYGWSKVPVVNFAEMSVGAGVAGPALVDAPQTTVVIYPGALARRTERGSLIIDPAGAAGQAD